MGFVSVFVEKQAQNPKHYRLDPKTILFDFGVINLKTILVDFGVRNLKTIVFDSGGLNLKTLKL